MVRAGGQFRHWRTSAAIVSKSWVGTAGLDLPRYTLARSRSGDDRLISFSARWPVGPTTRASRA
eukprot:scaffold51789_cov54-Phaeocystis_antarctica.AAC.10